MSLIGNSNDEKIWNYLLSKGLNKFGTAGLMGNLYAESELKTNNLENLCERRLKEAGKSYYTDESYTRAVDNGLISRSEFLNPLPSKQYGYGLAQWTSPSRKAGLYDLVKSRNVSISDLKTQLDFLYKELSTSYISVLSVLKSASSVKEASDIVLKRFECPADTGYSIQVQRANYGQIFYDKYANKNNGGIVMADYSKYYNSNGIHYISNSGSDENGKYSGGKAGDQTGNEWCLRSWYSRPWNCVLRYEKDSRVGMKLAELGCAAALNDKIGYDQYQRDTYWNQLKAVGYDPSKIMVACESDCSAGVIANTRAVGYLLGISALQNINATYTGNMRNGYKAAGFTVLTESKYTNGYSYLLPGDILLYDSAHTATNITIGSKSGYKNPSTPSIGSSSEGVFSKNLLWYGIVTADELSVRTWAGTSNPECSFSPLKNGTEVGVCGSERDSNGFLWYYIKYNGKYGFVHSGYIQKKESVNSDSSSVNSSLKVGYADSFSKSIAGTYKTTASLNLRAVAGVLEDGNIITVIPKGGKVACYGYYTSVSGIKWYLVVYGEYKGFVSSEYLIK